MDLTVQVQREAPGFWAHVVDLPGCFASGDSLDELHAALGEAIGLYLWDRPAELTCGELRVGEVEVRIEVPEAGD